MKFTAGVSSNHSETHTNANQSVCATVLNVEAQHFIWIVSLNAFEIKNRQNFRKHIWCLLPLSCHLFTQNI